MKRLNLIASVLILLLVGMIESCSPKRGTADSGTAYSEPYRPAFHFSPPSGWMNDPNGMVFHHGEYHLFYQHYPDSTVWGPMHWGHAVSKDLVHWENLPIALYPDSLGYIFSGSAVVDVNNTTGFGSEGNPAMVAMFTYHDMAGEKSGRIDYQTQGIAYSTDDGRTWTKYEGNPVIANPGIRDFRDPKLTWDEERKSWLLALAVTDHVEFYRSPDLKQWKKLSEFGKTIGNHGGVWECPDFFPMNDGEGNSKWVLLSSINPGGPQGGSATQYFIGDFDGMNFVSQDTVTRWIDYGADNYAGVTWSGAPDTNAYRLFLGWMSNWQYAQVVPTGVWRSAMTLPRELSLKQRNGQFILFVAPAVEVDSLLGTVVEVEGSAELKVDQARIQLTSDGKPFTLTFSNEKGEKLVVGQEGTHLYIDRTAAGRNDFHPGFATVHRMNLDGIDAGAITVYLDRSSVEVFTTAGLVMTDIVFPTVPYSSVELKGENRKFTIAPVTGFWGDKN